MVMLGAYLAITKVFTEDEIIDIMKKKFTGSKATLIEINKKALELIEKGLSSKTVSKLDESQINILHKKLFLGEQVEEIPTKKSYKVGQDGGNLPPSPKGYNVKKTETGDVVATPNESEMSEQDDLQNNDALGADAMQSATGQETPHMADDMAPDGMDDDSDDNRKEMGESKKKKDEPNPWAICHSQVGPKKSRKWERCVREVKKQLAEGKNPVSLFIENQIMKIVEKNLPPRITKGDLVKYLTENSPSVAPTKPTTKPGTKPGTKPQRPAHPGKNPNPGENPAPKAKGPSAEDTKDKVIDVILNLLQN